MASLLRVIAILALLLSLATASCRRRNEKASTHTQSTTDTVPTADAEPPSSNQAVIFNDSNRYDYHGCFNETTEIVGSSQNRALPDGASDVKNETMTVQMCLDFCSTGSTVYRYAGLEWSRECWCSQRLSPIAERLDDNQCTYPCEGNSSQVCGGSLKLSVYVLSSATRRASFSTLGMAVAAAAGLWLLE